MSVWKFAPHDASVIRKVSHEFDCSPLLAQILVARGVTSGRDARLYLSANLHDLHDPGLLPGANEAADRVVAALKAHRRITIYGDYDVDGVTATSILWHCLKLAGATVDYYIPSRLEEGYGLNLEALRTLHEEDPDRLVITVDCGIASVAEAQLARELGLELIITDHHTITPELPPAACLMHPRLPGGEYPFGDLCGAGVAFKLAWAICQRLGDGKKASPRMREYLIQAIGLAAIGTVADVVPLVGENRIIVKNGLAALSDRAPLGLQVLMKVSQIEPGQKLDSDSIGFALAPRINAAGRLGQARLAVELLTTDSPNRAMQLAEYVDQLNKERQSVERRIYKSAKEKVLEHGWEDSAGLVLADADWHPGVIGIVASRIAEHFGKPAVMIALNEAEGQGQGSGRTYHGIDLYSGLAGCREHLVTFGGHRAAAGLRVEAKNIDTFREAFNEQILSLTEGEAIESVINIDSEVMFSDLTHRNVKELDRLGPFGAEHRRPRLAVMNVELVEPPKKMGGGDRHLSLRIKQGQKVLRGVAFGKGDWADEIPPDTPLSVCFSPNINRYKGYESVELQLVDWKPAEKPSTVAAR